MEHRNIEIKEGEWNLEIIHSYFERGSDWDIIALLREARKNPEVAKLVKEAVQHSQVYGIPKMFNLYLKHVYGF
ncbi:MAG: hypothetical protein U9R02_06395 [Thermodesulfobacteriota bacterium]|nr:hypothetical protein [Thermodesulfobacteriota bacterium]